MSSTASPPAGDPIFSLNDYCLTETELTDIAEIARDIGEKHVGVCIDTHLPKAGNRVWLRFGYDNTGTFGLLELRTVSE